MDRQNEDVVVGFLHELGWRAARTDLELAQQVRTFQGAWMLGTPLKVDGDAGAFTCTALGTSVGRKRKGMSTASPHFSFAEFACECRSSCAGCLSILIQRPALIGAERLHDAFYPGGLEIVSGYRCPEHNKAKGGKPDSQHLWGSAIDIAMLRKTADVARLGVWSGIGYQQQTGLVRHVDVRGQGGAPNPPRGAGTTARPMTWIYC